MREVGIASIGNVRTFLLHGQGSSMGKEKKPNIILEEIADGELWIWGCNFGSPRSMNDINDIDPSSLVTDILEGLLLPKHEYTVNGKKSNGFYYLVHGIYPVSYTHLTLPTILLV